MRRSKRSEYDGHETAASGTGHQEESRSGKTRQKKTANKIITYHKWKGMIYVGIDLHKKTTWLAVVDEA